MSNANKAKGVWGLVRRVIVSMIFIVPMFLYKQFINNNKSVCILSILFILSILIYKTAFQNWYTFTALIITGLLLSFCILKNIKNETNLTYLPLVPAFSIAALYFLFF